MSRDYVSLSFHHKITLNVKVQISIKSLPTFSFRLMIFEGKVMGMVYLSVESLEWAVQLSRGCCKCGRPLKAAGCILYSYSICTERGDRIFQWQVQTPRLVPPPALWEIWVEDLFCWDLACPKQSMPLGSPRLKQWAAESNAWIASTYILFAPLLCSTAAWLITVTHLSSLLSPELDWVSFNKSAF